MKRKISGSIFFTSLGTMILVLSLVMGFLYDYFGDIQKKQLAASLDLAAAAVEEEGIPYLQRLSAKSTRFTLVSSDGTVLFDSINDAADMENHAEREEIKEAYLTGIGESHRYSSTMLRKDIYRAIRLPDGTVLRISIKSATVPLLLIGMYQIIVLILIIIVAAALFTGRQISLCIVKPFDELDLNAPLENEDAYPELAPLLRKIDRQNTEISSRTIELQRKTEEFNKITENMNEGLVLLDGKQRILSINKAAMNIFGSSADRIGEDFILLDRKSEILQSLSEAIKSGSSEIESTRGSSTYRFNISRIESNGSIAGTVILILNITEQLQIEKNRREFTANISHEMKTPLQNIIGRAGLIIQGGLNESDIGRFADYIQNEAMRMSSLIDDILYLSKLDEGIAETSEPIDLHDEILRATDSLVSEAEKKSVDIVIASNSASVMAPRNLVYEIILNLCSNAIRYNIEGGRVHISVEDSGNRTVMTVSDSGVGIPPEDIDHIFERFYRVDKSRSRLTGGTGLGLAIVKHAAERIGAEVDVVSIAGTGTTFRVSFPKR